MKMIDILILAIASIAGAYYAIKTFLGGASVGGG
jgi:uncharacterized protein (UPF0333 family)